MSFGTFGAECFLDCERKGFNGQIKQTYPKILTLLVRKLMLIRGESNVELEPKAAYSAVMELSLIQWHHSLLRRGLLQSHWVETRGGWEEGKIKAHGERPAFSLFPSFPTLPFPSLTLPLPSFFFHWCLLTRASA